MLATNRNQVVVILGMHRSGTSLLGGVLQSLGVKFGNRLIEGDSNNAGGYFEHASIVRLHRDLLQHLDRRWTGSKGTLPFPMGWQHQPEAQRIQSQLRSVVAEELQQAQGLWGFKDPRASRFVPLWNEIFAELGLRPLYVLAVRHPLAVAGSVIKRDALSSARAQLLWLLHTVEAVRDSGDQLCCVVEFDRWFTSPTEQAEALLQGLGLTVPAGPNGLPGVLAEHIRPELRHHVGNHQDCLPYAAELYRCMVTAASTGRVPAEFNEIAAAVQRAQHLLQAWSEVIEALPPAVAPNQPAASSPAPAGLRETLASLAGKAQRRLQQDRGQGQKG